MNLNRRSLIRGAAGSSLMLASGRAALPSELPANPLLDVFAERQSVRKYTSKPVPEEHVRRMIDAARYAPTCMNEQPWKFLVVRDKARIDQMRKGTLENITDYFKKQLEQKTTVTDADLAPLNEAIARTEGYFTAPVYVVVLVDKECQCGQDYQFQDGVLAAGYLLLAARALGYGTVYLTDGVPEQVTREVLEILPLSPYLYDADRSAGRLAAEKAKEEVGRADCVREGVAAGWLAKPAADSLQGP